VELMVGLQLGFLRTLTFPAGPSVENIVGRGEPTSNEQRATKRKRATSNEQATSKAAFSAWSVRPILRPILKFFHNLLCNSPLLQIYEVVFQLQSGDL
jgi:hypothetical protein